MDIDKDNAEMPNTYSSIEECKSEMEAACQEFLKAAEVFVAGWYKDMIKSGLTANAKAAMAMGEDGLRKIKMELNEVLAALPDLLETNVNTNKWLHRKKLPEGSNRRFGINLVKDFRDDHLNQYIQSILGYIGKLLIKYEIADSKWDTCSGNGLPIYKGSCTWSESMENALRRYADSCDKWINLDNDLKKSEKLMTDAKISDLWDKL